MPNIPSLVYSRLINNEQMKECLRGSGTTRNGTPSAFPYLCMKALGESTTGSSLQNKQCVIQAVLEITIYDSTSNTKAEQLVFPAADLIQKMGFTIDYGSTEIDRANITETYRWIVRLKRTYCGGGLVQQLYNLRAIQETVWFFFYSKF